NKVTKIIKKYSINEMDVDIKQRFRTGFISANCAGKSTVIKMIMNLLKTDAGEVRIFNQNYQNDEKAIKERIGFVFDGNVFFEGLNMKDIKRLVAPAYKH